MRGPLLPLTERRMRRALEVQVCIEQHRLVIWYNRTVVAVARRYSQDALEQCIPVMIQRVTCVANIAIALEVGTAAQHPLLNGA